jgi:FAD/FMN-containing dehydrogenase
MLNGAEALVADLQSVLDGDQVTVDLRVRRAASKDYAWMSPILARRLPATLADVVVRPRSTEDVVKAVGLAHRRGVPITPRGKGTGNYGQSVPLRNGMALDMTEVDGIEEVGKGWVRAGAGIRFSVLEAASRRTQQELTLIPSTVHSTLGGFVSGGSVGAGSIENGFNDQGFVVGLDVIPCWDDPEPVWVEGESTTNFVHTFGTTGVICRCVARLGGAKDWTSVWASFRSIQDAAAAGTEIMATVPAPRLVGITEPGLVATFPEKLDLPLDMVSLRAIVERSLRSHAEAVVVEAGGRIEEVPREASPLSLSFNHVGLRAKLVRPELCQHQIHGPFLENTDTIREIVPGSMLHFDGLRVEGAPGYIGLLDFPFVNEEVTASQIVELRKLGIRVIDTHSWTLPRHSSVHGEDALAKTRETAAKFDPDGLLNPGRFGSEGGEAPFSVEREAGDAGDVGEITDFANLADD